MHPSRLGQAMLPAVGSPPGAGVWQGPQEQGVPAVPVTGVSHHVTCMVGERDRSPKPPGQMGSFYQQSGFPQRKTN